MVTSLPLAARVPHTVKPPSQCPYCGSTRLIRKGTRRKKLEVVQLWQCKLCRRVFTPASAELRYKTYPLRVILDGVTLYNLGYSLPDAVAKLKFRHGYKVSPSTLAGWMSEHRQLTTYSRLRRDAPAGFTPAQTIRSTKAYHRQVYSFAYHRPKLALLRENRQHARFVPLADFLGRVPNDCPHELFRESSRASQIPNFVNPNHLIVVEKENFATRTAALIIPSVGNNRLRHETDRLRSSRDDRGERAQQQMRDRDLDAFTFRSVKYEGRTVRLNDFAFDKNTKIKEIRIRQGVNRELINEIAGSGISLQPDALNQRLDAYTADAKVKVVTRGTRTTLTYGQVLFATLDLK
jgi:transposase-like protein